MGCCGIHIAEQFLIAAIVVTLRRSHAAVFGAFIGLVSMASMIIVVGSEEQDTTAVILSGFVVFVAQACSIATGEFVSGSSQLDRKVAPMNGAMVPLLATSLIRKYKVGLGVVVAIASFALVVSGWLWAILDRAPVWKSVMMFLVGGWIYMAFPLGLNMLFGKEDFE
ncbi:Vacuolar iron transporter-like 3 [Spatholobus suberectus]|nr:Vacuolar iron transporter-like 3 [Spatholobus suberectus]